MYCQQCGHPTEERVVDGRMRPVCVDCGAVTWIDPKVAVAVVIERDGKILLGLRGSSTREPGKWGLPAGFVDRGERVEDAAIREMREETGLCVTLGPILAAISDPGDPVILLVYPALAADGNPAAGDDLTELGWFSPDALPDLAFGHDDDILAIWQKWRTTPRTAV